MLQEKIGDVQDTSESVEGEEENGGESLESKPTNDSGNDNYCVLLNHF